MPKKKTQYDPFAEDFDLYDNSFEKDAVQQLTTQTRQRTFYEDTFDQYNQEVHSLWKTSGSW
jgi:hypothetical protein